MIGVSYKNMASEESMISVRNSRKGFSGETEILVVMLCLVRQLLS